MNSSIVLFVVAAAIIGCVQAGEIDKEAYIKFETECVEETGVDLALIANAKEGKFEDVVDFKCFPKCFFVKAGFMTDEGDLNLDAIKAAHEEMGDLIDHEVNVDECLEKKGESGCETADLVFKCYWEAITKA